MPQAKHAPSGQHADLRDQHTHRQFKILKGWPDSLITIRLRKLRHMMGHSTLL